ncbi:hypothetical protein B195_009445 [Pseudomonas sp. Lz4W]|jgi:hypothetical protein|nr:hypothetical protein AV641_09490 [Pseudomonas fragi]AUB75036.1 hypothetical protein B195_009445 [Pseudomonas sp. Lz4W]
MITPANRHNRVKQRLHQRKLAEKNSRGAPFYRVMPEDGYIHPLLYQAINQFFCRIESVPGRAFVA